MSSTSTGASPPHDERVPDRCWERVDDMTEDTPELLGHRKIGERRRERVADCTEPKRHQ